MRKVLTAGILPRYRVRLPVLPHLGNIGFVRGIAGSYLAVITGPWIFGRTVVIPAGIVTNIDHANRRIYLDGAKDEIKSAPDYSDEPAYWDKVAAHYGQR